MFKIDMKMVVRSVLVASYVQEFVQLIAYMLEEKTILKKIQLAQERDMGSYMK